MKLTNGCAIFGDKNGPQGSGTYFSINKVMASLRAPSYANLMNTHSILRTCKDDIDCGGRWSGMFCMKEEAEGICQPCDPSI